MNRFKVATIFLLFFACLGLMSNSPGRATQTGNGASGAPGQGTCGNAGCHAAGNFDPSIDIIVLDEAGDEVDSYYPGDSYKVRVTVTAGTGMPAAYGFQMLALDMEENDISLWSNPTSNAHIVPIGDLTYIEHNAPSNSNIFEIDWTSDSNLDATNYMDFYVAGNAVNGNGSPGQDGSSSTVLRITRNMEGSVNQADEVDLVLSPNPVRNLLNVNLIGEYTSIEVIDLIGKRVISTVNKQIDLSHLAAGTYIAKVNLPDGQIASRKIIKL